MIIFPLLWRRLLSAHSSLEKLGSWNIRGKWAKQRCHTKFTNMMWKSPRDTILQWDSLRPNLDKEDAARVKSTTTKCENQVELEQQREKQNTKSPGDVKRQRTLGHNLTYTQCFLPSFLPSLIYFMNNWLQRQRSRQQDLQISFYFSFVWGLR